MDGGDPGSPYRARPATLKDVEAIAEVMLAVHATDPYAHPINWQKATRFVMDTIDHGAVIIMERGELVVATAAFVGPFSWWYSDDEYLQDAWFLVHPDHGQLELFFALCDAVDRIGAATGLKPVISLFGANRVYAKDRLFRMRYQDMGDTFIGR
jgi:hypothetical protein